MEHRKEKAALEARLQLSQCLLKTLQEKVVDLSFRTNQSHAQSESKVSMLTTDLKVPSMANSRRESTSSIASNRSDASTASRAGMLPHGAGRFFMAEDEDGELFSSSYLNEMKEGT